MFYSSKSERGNSEGGALLLIGDVAALRAKLGSARGPLQHYWANYLELAKSGAEGEFQALPPLAWLVTGEEKYAKATRSVFLKLLESLPLADESVEAQLHSYPVGAPLARFCIFLDWIWDSGILTSAEQHELAAGLVTQIYSHCYLRLKGRLPASDNQQMSMSFSCAVAGYVFGSKRGSSPAARRMGAEGFHRFRGVVAKIPDGGWSGEGSTYHHQTICPILSLFTAFMEEVTGKDYFFTSYGGGTVEEVLKIAAQTINTAGMLPGWDEYGNRAPELKTHLVFLARRTQDPSPLALIEHHHLWSENELLAWYNDDKVWSLVFWPDLAVSSESSSPSSWLNASAAGRLISRGGDLDLLQMWDVMGAGRPLRAHINPNNVEICAKGALLTCDGRGRHADRSYFKTEDGMAYAAAHSVVLVDELGYEYPEEECHGTGTRICDLPSFQLIRGDVSALYKAVWGVDSMSRTSCLIGGRIVLLHDAFSSPQPHRLTWQMMLRPEVTVDGSRATQRMREGVLLEVAAAEGSRFSVQEISGYPRDLEVRAHRISFDVEAIGEGSIPVALRARRSIELVMDLSSGWHVKAGGLEIPHELCLPKGQVSLSGEYFGPDPAGQTLWFGGEWNVSESQAAQVTRLSLARAQVDRLEVWVNGKQMRPMFHDPSIVPGCYDAQKPDGRFWPSHFDVAGHIVPGRNHVAIASSDFRGQSICGPVQIHREAEPPAELLEISSNGGLVAIRDGDETWSVLLNNEDGNLRDLPGGGQTDAAAALVGDGVLALAGFTKCTTPSLRLESCCALDVEVSKDDMEVWGPSEGGFVLNVFTEDGPVRISDAGADPDARLPWKVVVRRKSPDHHCEVSAFAENEPVFPDPQPAANESGVTCSYDVPAPIGSANPSDAALVEMLNHPDWRHRLGAVEIVGANGCRWAIPRLVEMLAEEEAADLSLRGLGNWPMSKMKTTFVGWTRGDLPETVHRGHRLKTILLEALGRLQAREALPMIQRILERQSDFYPTLVQACRAVDRMSARELLPALEGLTNYPEQNTRLSARALVATFREQGVSGKVIPE